MSEPRKKRVAPVSVRLSAELRALLDRLAASAGMSVNAFIIMRVFDKSVSIRQARKPHPVKDQALLAQILGALGRSHIASNLNQLAKAMNSSSLLLNPETEALLKEACKAIIEIRDLLLKALGLKPD